MDKLERRQNAQPIAWFRDLHARGLLDLDPPYQRRSVWNQAYKDYFVETVLLNYPAPPVFIHESISPEGVAKYSVVDGKQRLNTILDFVDDLFPVSEKSAVERLQGQSFAQFDDLTKMALWNYKFTVEYLPNTDEGVLNDIFNRLNRNVARLTRQELRRARFSGEFATSAEEMSDYLAEELPSGFPRIALASRRQMKDVEIAALLLLLAEVGPASMSQDELDEAYAARDDEWERRHTVEREFRQVVGYLRELSDIGEHALASSRLRNQADFYSLFGAVIELRREDGLLAASAAAAALHEFIDRVGSEAVRQTDESAKDYFEAARSASNDLRQRRTRIRLLREVLMTRQ